MHELSIGMAALALVDCKLYSMAASLAIMLLLSQSSGDKISMGPSNLCLDLTQLPLGKVAIMLNGFEDACSPAQQRKSIYRHQIFS